MRHVASEMHGRSLVPESEPILQGICMSGQAEASVPTCALTTRKKSTAPGVHNVPSSDTLGSEAMSACKSKLIYEKLIVYPSFPVIAAVMLVHAAWQCHAVIQTTSVLQLLAMSINTQTQTHTHSLLAIALAPVPRGQ